MINYFVLKKKINDTNGRVSVGIFMNPISWPQDGQLKKLIQVVSAGIVFLMWGEVVKGNKLDNPQKGWSWCIEIAYDLSR